jgi:putative transcriptional regulator
MSPSHHPPEDLLLAYAAGTTGEAVSLFLATHLTLCPGCRLEVARGEALGGLLLGRLEPAGVAKGALDQVLARLDAPPPAEPPPAAPAQSSVLPRPLRDYVGDYGSLSWRRVAPGIHKVDLPMALNGIPVRLARLRGGLRVPEHTHGGLELQIVLAGGFTDGPGHYVRGDVQVGEPEVRHAMRIDLGEDCVTLLVMDARLVQLSLWGRMFAAVTGV